MAFGDEIKPKAAQAVTELQALGVRTALVSGDNPRSAAVVAQHTAGITLIRGDPALVAEAIDLSRHTVRKIHQNLFWAFVFNAIGSPLAAAGSLTPVVAGSAMAFSSVTVVSNALLLRRWKGGEARRR